MTARTLTDGEREVVAELNADAYDPEDTDLAQAWDEAHAGCDVEPCADCLAVEQLDAEAYAPLIADYQAEFARDSHHDPVDLPDDYPF